jgi:hypothetical protein
MFGLNNEQIINLNFILEKLIIQNDINWLNEKLIYVSYKKDYWILNYIPGSRNEYNCLTRGLVVKKPTGYLPVNLLELIKSFSFVRFYNHGEKEAANINFANSVMLEKLDGTMVALFNDDGKTLFNTRRMLSIDDIDQKTTSFLGKEFQLLKVIEYYINQLKNLNKYKDFTLSFECIHEATKVITTYQPEQYGLYLLACRNKEKEFSEDFCKEVAEDIGCFRPKVYHSINDLNDITRIFSECNSSDQNFEGFVFRDIATGERLKVKDPEYVRKHHQLGETNLQSLLIKIFDNEEDEILSYFPNLKNDVELLKNNLNNYIENLSKIVESWRNKNLTTKDLAYELVPQENRLTSVEKKLRKIRKEQYPVVKSLYDEFATGTIFKLCRERDKNSHKYIYEELKKMTIGINGANGNPLNVLSLIIKEENK